MPRSIQNQKLLSKKKTGIIVLALVAIGTAAFVYASAATDYRAQFITKGNITMSYVSEKPVVVAKQTEEINQYESRPRTIDVSKTGNLYCTPEDTGDVTVRTLADTERQGIISLITRAKSEPLPAEEVSGDQQAVVNNYRALFIRDMGVDEDANVYTPGLESPLFNETVSYLEGLCAVPGTAIPDKELPQWDLIVPQAKTSMERKPSLIQKVANAITPTVEAGGSAPGPVAPVPVINHHNRDKAHEDAISARFTQMRANAGSRALDRVECLNLAAHDWARLMAASNVLQHSKPISARPIQYCGNNWVKLGENVGVVGIPVGADLNATSHAANVVMNAYWNSPGHRANIVDNSWNLYGVGAWRTPNGLSVYNAHVFWAGAINK